MSNIKVSVILTSYNNSKYLKRAIDSVLNQTYDNFELILADDNSSDQDTLDIIKDYIGRDKVIYFNSNIEEDKRLLTARYATQINTAAYDYATGDYFCYLADDDFLYPNMLEEMVKFVEQTNHHVVFCKQDVVDIDGNVCGTRFFEEPLTSAANKTDHNQVMTSRESFSKVGGWDDSPSYWGGADAMFWGRLNHAGYIFYPLDNHEPLHAKMYRENSVQWNIANSLSPIYRPDNAS